MIIFRYLSNFRGNVRQMFGYHSIHDNFLDISSSFRKKVLQKSHNVPQVWQTVLSQISQKPIILQYFLDKPDIENSPSYYFGHDNFFVQFSCFRGNMLQKFGCHIVPQAGQSV